MTHIRCVRWSTSSNAPWTERTSCPWKHHGTPPPDRPTTSAKSSGRVGHRVGSRFHRANLPPSTSAGNAADSLAGFCGKVKEKHQPEAFCMGCSEWPTTCPFTGPVIWYQASAGSSGSPGLPSMASSALTLRVAAESRWLRSLAPAGEGGQFTLRARIAAMDEKTEGQLRIIREVVAVYRQPISRPGCSEAGESMRGSAGLRVSTATWNFGSNVFMPSVRRRFS